MNIVDHIERLITRKRNREMSECRFWMDCARTHRENGDTDGYERTSEKAQRHYEQWLAYSRALSSIKYARKVASE